MGKDFQAWAQEEPSNESPAVVSEEGLPSGDLPPLFTSRIHLKSKLILAD